MEHSLFLPVELFPQKSHRNHSFFYTAHKIQHIELYVLIYFSYIKNDILLKMHWALNIRLTKYILYDKINNRFEYSEIAIIIIDNVVKEGI